jgi:alkylation response protein AidB-like acyl-CoA dehydrogenase
MEQAPLISDRDSLERARALAPLVASCADQIEAERRLPPVLLEALFDAGFFRLLLPRPFGGLELDPMTFTAIIETIAKEDASTAWCLGQAAGCTMFAAYLKPDAAMEVFGRDPKAVLAWGPGPARAVVAPGGFRVTGNWSFASGGRHATWLGAHCPVFEADGTPWLAADGSPVLRTVVFPAASGEMTDIWDVIGLKGTASDAYAVRDLFVPNHLAAPRDDQSARIYQGPLYAFQTTNLYAAGFAGVALGIARKTLDGFIQLTKEKTPRGLKGALRENAVVQSQVAQSEARLSAARLFLMMTLEEIWRDVARVNSVTLDQRLRIRLASTYAITEATAVVDTVYHAAGASAIFASSVFERRFRDIHTVSQQVQGRAAHFETVGRCLLGLEPDTTIFL